MHTLRFVLGWVLCGLVVGLIARLLVPGRHPLGVLRTVLLGILGAVIGGLIYWIVVGEPARPFSLAEDAWHGWLVSILGAVILLWIYTAWERSRRRWWRPRTWW